MGWPAGRPRPKKAGTQSEPVIEVEPVEIEREPNQPPADWTKGQLLNVRNYGHAYIITAYPAEHDPLHPERSMEFTNPGECQDFVSAWYARESYNPLAR